MNANELNSYMLYIHPPLAIAGYILIFLFTTLIFFQKQKTHKRTSLLGVSAWILTFLGLFTGMLWAQLAWGSYWSWDPKETMTLVLFLTVSLGQVVYHEKKFTAARWIAVLACALTILTALSSFIIMGLHSYS